jgi:transposase
MKSVEQQTTLTLHRVRQGFVEEKTAIINRMRGLLMEFGVVIPLRPIEVRRRIFGLLEQLPALAAGAMTDLHRHLTHLESIVREYDQRIALTIRKNMLSTRTNLRLRTVPDSRR